MHDPLAVISPRGYGFPLVRLEALGRLEGDGRMGLEREKPEQRPGQAHGERGRAASAGADRELGTHRYVHGFDLQRCLVG